MQEEQECGNHILERQADEEGYVWVESQHDQTEMPSTVHYVFVKKTALSEMHKKSVELRLTSKD